MDVSALKRWWGPIAALASMGVVVSAGITTLLLWLLARHMGCNLPLAWCALFGALIAPTDPLAALAVVRRVGAPLNLRMKLVGESLFNDGIGVVLFLMLLGFIQGGSSFAEAGAALVQALAGAALIGGGLGLVALRALASIDDYPVEVLITLALATGSYALADMVGASAPIATVVGGLVIGHKARREGLLSERTRGHLNTFWQTLDELLNALLFSLMGLEILALDAKADQAVLGLIAWGCVVAGRWAGVALCLWPFRYRRRPGTVAVLTWGGLRGSISLALALSLPASEHTGTLVVVTYVVVVASCLIQGTTLGAVVRHGLQVGAGVPDSPSVPADTEPLDEEGNLSRKRTP